MQIDGKVERLFFLNIFFKTMTYNIFFISIPVVSDVYKMKQIHAKKNRHQKNIIYINYTNISCNLKRLFEVQKS